MNSNLSLFFVLCNILAHVEAKGAAVKKKSVDPGDSIEWVDSDRIDEIIDEGDTHLLVFFYDVKAKCPNCPRALAVLEEIDDDLEESGLIEVVKSDDKAAHKLYGVFHLPAIVYFRRRNPILYDGEFETDEILRWVHQHDTVETWKLDDDDFEDYTNSYSPNEWDLDWFVMFYDSHNEECTSLKGLWEAVAHKLRGMIKVGEVDIHGSDDVAQRFKIDDDDDCPEFILFHRGRMFEYKDTALNLRQLVSFALNRYKQQRGHRVPEPPSYVEEVFESIKEPLVEFLSSSYFIMILSTLLVVGGTTFGMYKIYRRRKMNANPSVAPGATATEDESTYATYSWNQ